MFFYAHTVWNVCAIFMEAISTTVLLLVDMIYPRISMLFIGMAIFVIFLKQYGEQCFDVEYINQEGVGTKGDLSQFITGKWKVGKYYIPQSMIAVTCMIAVGVSNIGLFLQQRARHLRGRLHGFSQRHQLLCVPQLPRFPRILQFRLGNFIPLSN